MRSPRQSVAAVLRLMGMSCCAFVEAAQGHEVTLARLAPVCPVMHVMPIDVVGVRAAGDSLARLRTVSGGSESAEPTSASQERMRR